MAKTLYLYLLVFLIGLLSLFDQQVIPTLNEHSQQAENIR